jgi:hypothetical protein
LLFIKPQCGGSYAAACGHLPDGQHSVHDASVATFSLDFKCT